jgi:hypothetical protein
MPIWKYIGINTIQIDHPIKPVNFNPTNKIVSHIKKLILNPLFCFATKAPRFDVCKYINQKHLCKGYLSKKIKKK